MYAIRHGKISLGMTLLLAVMLESAVGFGAPRECWQPWYNATSDASINEQCPYGIGLPGSVTWNTNMNPARRFFNVFYGYISFALPIMVGINALIKRGTRELLFIGSIALAVFVNEFGLKNLVLEPKPLGACAITCGMPSGHALTTIMYYVVLMVDYAFRVTRHKEQQALSMMNRIQHVFRLMSNSNTEDLSVFEFFALGFLWAVPLIPVPFSRVDNYDHTPKQVVIGAVIGAGCGLVTYGAHCVLARTLCKRAWQWPSSTKWYLLQNTIPFAQSTQEASKTKEADCEVGAGSRNTMTFHIQVDAKPA